MNETPNFVTSIPLVVGVNAIANSWQLLPATEHTLAFRYETKYATWRRKGN